MPGRHGQGRRVAAQEGYRARPRSARAAQPPKARSSRASPPTASTARAGRAQQRDRLRRAQRGRSARRSRRSPTRCSRRAQSTASRPVPRARRCCRRSSATPARSRTRSSSSPARSARTSSSVGTRASAAPARSARTSTTTPRSARSSKSPDSRGEAGQQLARTVAEHVTAGVPTVPVAVTRDDVPAALVDRERRIFAEQAAASGKPANIVEKMVQGRIDKYYKEVTLLDQPWIRDDSKAIRDLVKAARRRGLHPPLRPLPDRSKSERARGASSDTNASCSSSPAKRSPESKGLGFDFDTMDRFADEIAAVVRQGTSRRTRDRRRQHRSRLAAVEDGHGPRRRRLHGDARHGDQCARRAGRPRAEGHRDARHDGDPHGGARGALHPAPRPARTSRRAAS